MTSQRVLRGVALGPTHEATGYTRHYSQGALLPSPAALRVVRIAADQGFLLLYLDASGDVQTDTWHASVDDALEQARLEFGVKPDEWHAPPA